MKVTSYNLDGTTTEQIVTDAWPVWITERALENGHLTQIRLTFTDETTLVFVP